MSLMRLFNLFKKNDQNLKNKKKGAEALPNLLLCKCSLLELSQVLRANDLHGLRGGKHSLGADCDQEENGNKETKDSHQSELSVILKNQLLYLLKLHFFYLGNIGGVSKEGDDIFSDLGHVWWSVITHLLVVNSFVVDRLESTMRKEFLELHKYLSHTNSTTSEVGIVVHAFSDLDTSWGIAVASEKLKVNS